MSRPSLPCHPLEYHCGSLVSSSPVNWIWWAEDHKYFGSKCAESKRETVHNMVLPMFCCSVAPDPLWPKDCSPPDSSVHEFPRQEHWSGLPFSSPGDLPDPGIKLIPPVSPTFQVDSLPTELLENLSLMNFVYAQPTKRKPWTRLIGS